MEVRTSGTSFGTTSFRTTHQSVPRALRVLIVAIAVLQAVPGAGMARAQDIGPYLSEIRSLAEEARAAAGEAVEAGSVTGVKTQADRIFMLVWGVASGLSADTTGAARIHGWKTRWQVDGSEFDEAFAERYGTAPPDITDPRELGIMGRGLAARKLLQAAADDEATPAEKRAQLDAIIASLNNVIGWMKMDDGVTKAERQPRVDLTRKWNAPPEFWNSTADTGWLHELFSQAVNILKVRYDGDTDLARSHAEGLVTLCERVLNGVDADADGTVEPVIMEGGVYAALEQAQLAGYVAQ